jgi:hypothetical protein
MKREPLALAATLALLGGCATVVHGPYQEVRIDSDPPGATATIAPQLSERGPAFVDTEKTRTVTTPATVRLLRDNNYRVEISKPGYKIATTQIVSEYDWLWAPIGCGACEAVGALPPLAADDDHVAVRLAEDVFYDWPKGAVGAFGKGLRLFSPDALLGSSFKLKQKDSGYWSEWHGLGTPEIRSTLEPSS